ncbi:MAG: nitroreductase family protein [Candidatus Cloacimonetes bacterium]|nr:nitroreductase family protein [Candidatus Cloacimonadota bacterium]
MLREFILKNRSYRRFVETEKISTQTLVSLIDLARFSGSAANRQPLRYYLINQPNENGKVFDCLSWAGYLQDWPGPAAGERPAAYIIIATREEGKYLYTDLGIAAQSILLGAVEIGLGGCQFGSVNRGQLKEFFPLLKEYEILLVIALGQPREEIRLVEAKDDIRYWRDENMVHYVPKRPLHELIINPGDSRI